MPESKNEIIVYQPDETIRLEVRLENDTVWLNRHQMAQLFGRDIKTIGKHIANALREELSEFSTGAKFATVENPLQNTVVAKIATTAADGKTYQIEYYSLDVILSVGDRRRSGDGHRECSKTTSGNRLGVLWFPFFHPTSFFSKIGLKLIEKVLSYSTKQETDNAFNQEENFDKNPAKGPWRSMVRR